MNLRYHPDPRGESLTALPVAPKRTNSSWVLWQGSFYTWSGVSCGRLNEQHRQGAANGAQAPRHQIALGH